MLFHAQAAEPVSFIPKNMVSSMGSRLKTVEMDRTPGFTVSLGNLPALEQQVRKSLRSSLRNGFTVPGKRVNDYIVQRSIHDDEIF